MHCIGCLWLLGCSRVMYYSVNVKVWTCQRVVQLIGFHLSRSPVWCACFDCRCRHTHFNIYLRVLIESWMLLVLCAQPHCRTCSVSQMIICQLHSACRPDRWWSSVVLLSRLPFLVALVLLAAHLLTDRVCSGVDTVVHSVLLLRACEEQHPCHLLCQSQ